MPDKLWKLISGLDCDRTENSLAIALVSLVKQWADHSFIGLFKDIAPPPGRDKPMHRSHLFYGLLRATQYCQWRFPFWYLHPVIFWGVITLGALMQSAQAFNKRRSLCPGRLIIWPESQSGGRLLTGIGWLMDWISWSSEIAAHDPHRIHWKKPNRNILRFLWSLYNQTRWRVCLIGDQYRNSDPENMCWLQEMPLRAPSYLRQLLACGLGERGNELPNSPVFFMPPRPYLPTGTLRSAICYPSTPDSLYRSRAAEALELVELEELQEQLDHKDNWASALSREQQTAWAWFDCCCRNPIGYCCRRRWTPWILTRLKCCDWLAQKLPEAAIVTITNEPLGRGVSSAEDCVVIAAFNIC